MLELICILCHWKPDVSYAIELSDTPSDNIEAPPLDRSSLTKPSDAESIVELNHVTPSTRNRIHKLPELRTISVKKYIRFNRDGVTAKVTLLDAGAEAEHTFFPRDYVQLLNAESQTPEGDWGFIKFASTYGNPIIFQMKLL